uniref:Uncharacterized protein MANES_03G076000 n=1 Tax=Rhizophora mucronata TaxID=61149 RepID=A0A2P2ILL3_RHIMU
MEFACCTIFAFPSLHIKRTRGFGRPLWQGRSINVFQGTQSTFWMIELALESILASLGF